MTALRDLSAIQLPLLNGWCPRFATRTYIASLGFLSFLQLQTELDEDRISGRSATGIQLKFSGGAPEPTADTLRERGTLARVFTGLSLAS